MQVGEDGPARTHSSKAVESLRLPPQSIGRSSALDECDVGGEDCPARTHSSKAVESLRLPPQSIGSSSALDECDVVGRIVRREPTHPKRWRRFAYHRSPWIASREYVNLVGASFLDQSNEGHRLVPWLVE
jgi:hypothetical protein